MKRIVHTIFFGNYFYGLCAVALSVEASLQQQYSLNNTVYYVFVFAATVLYYTHAYIAETNVNPSNERATWYAEHKKQVRNTQFILTGVALVAGAMLLQQAGSHIINASVLQWISIGIFPVTAALYYGSMAPLNATHSLRNNGWLKPFVIGFVWAGAVTVYPILFKSIEKGTDYQPGLVNLLLFIKNLMFITMLCIMFDFKDYAADHNHQLKTFVVRVGLRKTIYYIIIPLSLTGLGTFVYYATVIGHFPFGRIVINTLPFILLIIVAWSMHHRKSILYYLAVIDGLMLVKAICGIIGIVLIK